MNPKKWLMRICCALALLTAVTGMGHAQQLEVARIFIEYNESANDLGFHVFLDGEDWTDLRIVGAEGKKIFDVSAGGGFRELGLTELFFEGAEPTLDEVPLEELLAAFPEGEYTFLARTVDKEELVGIATLTHNVPAGPTVSTTASGGTVVVSWTPVTAPAAILPEGDVNVVAYQVITGTFQVTVPATVTSLTIPPEYFQSLPPGMHELEVLVIDSSGNQTITESSFQKQ